MTPLRTFLILGLAGLVQCVAVPGQKELDHDESTVMPVSQQAERRMSIDVDDNLGESSGGMGSYSSVVIHHPVASGHVGHQPTSQWTIDDHQSTQSHQNSHVEYSQQQPSRQTSQRHHRHHARSGASQSHIREDSPTTRPESLSTAQTFFRLRGYKGKTKTNAEENLDKEDSNSGLDDTTSTGQQYRQQSHLGYSSHPQNVPTGMSHDLMSALLSQHPQTFGSDYGFRSPSRSDDGERTGVKNTESQSRPEPTSRPSRKQQKKYKNQVQSEASEKAKKRLNNKNRDTFNVGYSIGFGNPTSLPVTEKPSLHNGPNDVVLGKPKSHGSVPNFKLHVNGENSVWKEMQPGVEISEETIKKTPASLTIPEKAISAQFYQDDPEIGILSGHSGQSVYFLNGLTQNYQVPTTGQATFDHAHALGQSNTFDFSNAVSHPLNPAQEQFPQSKQDTPKKSSRQKVQPIQFSKQLNIQQSFNSPTNPQKSVISHATQPFAYVPYALDSVKTSLPINSKNSHEFNSPSHSDINPFKGQPQIASSGLAGGYDLSHFMGFGTPVPIQNVFIPGKKDGEGQMVPAIVIPISQLSGFENFGAGLNYANEGSEGFQGFGSDVFNVLPQGAAKESLNSLNSGKYSSSKPQAQRNHDKPVRIGKAGSHGVSTHFGLSAPEHLDTSRPHPKHYPRSESHRPYSGQLQKINAPKFSHPDNFRESPANLKRSPSNRSARLAQLQSELNSILAEEMSKKNRPSRRHLPPHHFRLH